MKSDKPKTLFTWARTAHVPPRLKFEITAESSTKRWFPIYFKKRLDEAIKNSFK